MSDRIRRSEAEEVLRQVEDRFAGWIDGPETGPALHMEWDFLGFGPAPTIVWEDGPSDWAIAASLGGVPEELRVLYADAAVEFGVELRPRPIEPVGTETVYGEPATGWALSLFRR